MELRIKGIHVVKPAKPTCNLILPLSQIDQYCLFTTTSLIYIYNKPSISYVTIVDTLKDSLSRVLVPYHPMAGRVHWVAGGRSELHCNSMGVNLIEAESNLEISELGDLSTLTRSRFEELIPTLDYNEKPFHDQLPLLLVQLTRFRCGGLGLTMVFHHAVTDGIGASNFKKDWAKLARGEPLESSPYLDRHDLDPRRDNNAPAPLNKDASANVDNVVELLSPTLPTLIDTANKTLEEGRKETISTTLLLTKTQVDELKKVANTENEHDRPYSRFEAIAAHVWRCTAKARDLTTDQITTLCFCVDVRRRMDPPLPPTYFGNAIVDVSAYSQAQELISMPLSHTCRKIREVNEKVTADYVWSTIQFHQTQRRSNSQGGGYLNADPNLITISSWLSLPVRGLDFGWGMETYMGRATHDFDGDIAILPGYINDGSIVVFAALHVAHMKKFKQFFYEELQILAQG